MLSAALGTRTLDLGNPRLSMHSFRETGGTYDVDHAIRLFTGFFEHYSELAQDLRGLSISRHNVLAKHSYKYKKCILNEVYYPLIY